MRFYAASGFGWCFFFSPQLRKTIQSGLAMKIDEYQPTVKPTSRANAKSFVVSPPKK